MDEPANDNPQPVPEAGTADSAGAKANAVQRAPIVADIPTVAPSQRLPSGQSDAGEDAAEHATGEAQPAGNADAPPAPVPGSETGAPAPENVAQPVPEAAIWHQSDPEPSSEGPAAPFFLKVRETTAEPVTSEPAPRPAPTVTSRAELPPNAAADASAAAGGSIRALATNENEDRPPESTALVREEEVWSGPEAAATHAEAPAEAASAAHLPPSGGEAQIADGSTPAEPRVETVAPRGDLRAGLGLAAPAGAVPPAALRAAADWLVYLRRAAVAAGAAMAALVAGVLLLILAYRWIDPPTSMLMLGQRLAGAKIEQTWVPLDRISPNLMHAVILSEDGGFCRHRGVDWPALTQAIEDDRGGSTITMQVVKNLFLWPSRSYLRKALEIMLAYLVETVWPKQRVLEIYLNIAEWGPGIFGAEAAARHHFGKPAARLTAQEAALLAVALPSPLERESGYPGYQQRRLASNLLTRMRAVRSRPCVPTRRSQS